MPKAKISPEGQFTIPNEVRRGPTVESSDMICLRMEGKCASRDIQKHDVGFLKLASESFKEWNSPEAEEAFRNFL